ncbi:biotin--[acetyl-CoA-carboxylase] ligase [Dehalogenimonas sp. THU2]|uniref:biotin--[acetyl-CoA-carboxylase] ligase n=1 Tax=Dehalogenimonas sp. THU2 TaxID=3151121 RepID=UPI0032182392
MKLDYRSVENALSGCRWGQTILTFECIASTMDKARALAHKGAPEGTLVVAAEQTAGRGRLTRSWLSPAGSLSLSLLLYPSPDKLPYLTMLAGLAVAQSIERTTSLRTDLKWPNDVLIDSRKVAGILVESGMVRGRHFAVLGIGINVNVDISGYPEIADIATSLSDEAGSPVDAMALLRAAVVSLETLYTEFSVSAILQDWRKKLVTLGKPVRATLGDTVIEGMAIDITDDGALVIRQSDGNDYVVVAGDVTLRHAV